MWPLLQELVRDLFRLALAVGMERVDQWRSACLQSLARERQRLFEALTLLCLGLMLCGLGLSGLLLLAWRVMPEAWREPVMGGLLLLVTVAGLTALSLAWRRLLR